MSAFSYLPPEIREQIWIYASRPDNVHVHIRENPSGYQFDVKVARPPLKPVCSDHWVIGERARKASQSTHLPHQIVSEPITLRPYLDCLYLHCDTYDACLSLFSFYPSLTAAVVIDLQKINLRLDGCPELGCQFTAQNRTAMGRHQEGRHNEGGTLDCGMRADGTVPARRQGSCLIHGCSLVSNHQKAIREHWRKSHKGHTLAILPDGQSETWVSLRKSFLENSDIPVKDGINPRPPHRPGRRT
jgi:hypothetical protein